MLIIFSELIGAPIFFLISIFSGLIFVERRFERVGNDQFSDVQFFNF